MGMDESNAFSSDDFPEIVPQEAMEILDAGRTWNGGKPPATIRYGGTDVPNFFKDRPAQTILGAEQMAWFLEKLRASKATWKIWGNTTATLDMRADPQNIPAGVSKPWPGAGLRRIRRRRSQLRVHRTRRDLRFRPRSRDHRIRHRRGRSPQLLGGLCREGAAAGKIRTGGNRVRDGIDLSAGNGRGESNIVFPKEHPLRPLFLGQASGDTKPQPTVNMMLKHGVKSCLEYTKTGDIAAARAATNPDNAPHVSFVDMGGHGYSVVRVDKRCDRNGIRVHSAPDRAQRHRRRRPSSLSRSISHPDVETRRNAKDGNESHRRRTRSAILDLIEAARQRTNGRAAERLLC